MPSFRKLCDGLASTSSHFHLPFVLLLKQIFKKKRTKPTCSDIFVVSLNSIHFFGGIDFRP